MPKKYKELLTDLNKLEITEKVGIKQITNKKFD
jgi:hypothetical protein